MLLDFWSCPPPPPALPLKCPDGPHISTQDLGLKPSNFSSGEGGRGGGGMIFVVDPPVGGDALKEEEEEGQGKKKAD